MKKTAPKKNNSEPCSSTATDGMLKCVLLARDALGREHAVHCTAKAGAKPPAHATWSTMSDGRVKVIEYVRGKRTAERFEVDDFAIVPHRPMTLDDEPDDEPSIEPCGAPKIGVPGGCQLFEGHTGEHFAHFGGHAHAWRSGSDPNVWEVCGARWSMHPSEKGAKKVPKDVQTVCVRPSEHDGEHRGVNHIGNHMDEWGGDGAKGGCSHPKTKIDLVAEFLGAGALDEVAADEPPEIEPDIYSVDKCKKCGFEMGEHDGKKCPKPAKAKKAAEVSIGTFPITPVTPDDDRFAPRLTRIGEHDVHPAAALFPMIGKPEWSTFVEDVRTNGQRKKIVRIDVGGAWQILDGRNRLRACLEIGFQPRFRVFGDEPGDGADPIAFVVSENIHRRHLNETQRAFVGAELVPMYEAQAKERMLAGKRADDPGTHLAQGRATEHAARAVNVSSASIKHALTVNRDGAPEVIAAAKDRGQIKVSTAAKLTELTHQKQREIVDKVGGGELRSGKVRSLVQQEQKRAVVREINEQKVAPAALGPFGVIVIDPPWPYDNSDQHEGSRGHLDYPTMSIQALCDLAPDLEARAKPDCILGMWVTNAFIYEVGRILFAWGFDHRTMITWDKEIAGVGMLPRGQTEHLIIATRGAPVHTLNEITTLLRVKRREHSRKPDEMYALLAKHCSGPMIDMFSREAREGWAIWGAETTKFATEAA